MPTFTNISVRMRYDKALVTFNECVAKLPERWVEEQKARLLDELELGVRTGKTFWKLKAEAGVIILCWRGERAGRRITQENHVGSLLIY
jgi:hypothetical protein